MYRHAGFRLFFAAILSAATISGGAQAVGPTAPFDIVITRGHIVDGTGSPWYSGDIGIRDGRIEAIGNLSAAARKKTIDAAGNVVAPGFIDMLGQSELTMLVDPRLPSKIYQGITTEVTGEGGSVAPLNERMVAADQGGLRPSEDHSGLDDISRSTLRALRSRGWGSTWRVTWARLRCAAWCWAMRTCSQLLRSSRR